MGQEQLYVVGIVFGLWLVFQCGKAIIAAIIRFVGHEARKGWNKD